MARRQTTSTAWICSTPWRPTSRGIPAGWPNEQVPAQQVPVHDRPRCRAGGALSRGPARNGRMVGGGAGQPDLEPALDRAQHLAAVRRSGTRGAGHAQLCEAVRIGRASFPDADPVHRVVRTRLLRTAGIPARVRRAIEALAAAVSGYRDVMTLLLFATRLMLAWVFLRNGLDVLRNPEPR